MKLTDTAIRKALKLAERQKLFDGGGLYLLVDPPKQPGWRLKYRMASREKLLSLGVYPDTSLQLARRAREDAKRLIAAGTDPSEERKATRDSNAVTFRAVAEDRVSRQAKTLAPETISIHRASLTSTLFPAFGSKPMTSIEPKDLLGVLRRIEDKGNHGRPTASGRSTAAWRGLR